MTLTASALTTLTTIITPATAAPLTALTAAVTLGVSLAAHPDQVCCEEREGALSGGLSLL